MTVAISTLLPEVLPYVADCPAVLAEQALRNAAIEFCEKTQLWTYDVTAIDTVSGTATYTPTVPAETKMVELLQVWYKDTPLHARSADTLTAHYRPRDWRAESGPPLFHFRERQAVIKLVPNPDTSETGALKLRVALAPLRSGTLLGADVAERFAEVIAQGARQRLYSTPGQPFFNAAEAAKCERRFLSGITNARISANRGNARAVSAVQFNGGFL